MSKKNLIEICKEQTNYTMGHSRNEVNLFCDIMEWSKEDVYFVGDDPHGVVSLGDYFFNMSDIHEVIANYEKYIKRFGSNEELSNVIIRWYDWTTDWHNKHMPMDWVKVRRYNALTKQEEFVTPEVQEGKSVSENLLFRTNGFGVHYGFYDRKGDLFVGYSKYSFHTADVLYWMEIRKPDDSHNINLLSWLMGACDIVKS